MRALWLPDVLRDAGCKVREVDGWQERGKELTAIEGIVWHHTATGPNWTNQAVEDLLVKGRPDLAGPLSQLGLERDGTFVVVAAGRANHNGYGEWGNASIGCEAYNSGVGEPWPSVQVAAFDKGAAAILAHLHLGADRMKGHRETDPKRKIDPKGIDLDAARQRIAHLITYRPPTPTPEPKDWLDMATAQEVDDIIKARTGEQIGWARALAENPELPQNSKRLADRAEHLNPYRKK